VGINLATIELPGLHRESTYESTYEVESGSIASLRRGLPTIPFEVGAKRVL
jgi:hypothetical protein